MLSSPRSSKKHTKRTLKVPLSTSTILWKPSSGFAWPGKGSPNATWRMVWLTLILLVSGPS